jgi:hypothetical protein
MKITFAFTLFLVADAFARAPVPTLLVCAHTACETAACRAPANATRELVREEINLQDDGTTESGRAVAAKDIAVEGRAFKLVADGDYSRNSDGTAYAPHVTVQLTADGGNALTARSSSGFASLALAKGSIDCRLE